MADMCGMSRLGVLGGWVGDAATDMVYAFVVGRMLSSAAFHLTWMLFQSIFFSHTIDIPMHN